MSELKFGIEDISYDSTILIILKQYRTCDSALRNKKSRKQLGVARSVTIQLCWLKILAQPVVPP